MYIFSNDGETFVNSDNVKSYMVICEFGACYSIMADDVCLASYQNKPDAVKDLNDIFKHLE